MRTTHRSRDTAASAVLIGDADVARAQRRGRWSAPAARGPRGSSPPPCSVAMPSSLAHNGTSESARVCALLTALGSRGPAPPAVHGFPCRRRSRTTSRQETRKRARSLATLEASAPPPRSVVIPASLARCETSAELHTMVVARMASVPPPCSGTAASAEVSLAQGMFSALGASVTSVLLPPPTRPAAESRARARAATRRTALGEQPAAAPRPRCCSVRSDLPL